MLAIQLLLLLSMLVFTVIVRWTFKNEDEDQKKDDDVADVMFMASDKVGITPPSSYYKVYDDLTPPVVVAPPSYKVYDNVLRPVAALPPYECALCGAPTSTRCSRCKAVRYCSSKCQIMHWRQGHMYECNPPATIVSEGDHLNGNTETLEQREATGSNRDGSVPKSIKSIIEQLHNDNSGSHNTMPRLSSVTNDPMDSTTTVSNPGEHESPVMDNHGRTRRRKKDPSNIIDPPITSAVASSGLVHSKKNLNKDQSALNDTRKSMASIVDSSSGKMNNKSGAISGDAHRLESKKALDVDILPSEGHEYSKRSKSNVVRSFPGTDSRNSSLQPRSKSSSSRLPHLGLKSSLQKVVHNFKPSHHKKPSHQNSLLETSDNHNHKPILQYDTFLKLYSSNEVELKPFGLINCGNSCYANAVLQCLAYTRPLTLYLLQGFHSKECWKEEWCFICEFEHLIQKARESNTPLSPIRILTHISHLGHGKQEDAHEFLRYAVDTMQSVCVQLAGIVGPLVEEATLVSMTFGGYLHSKIKCMKCNYKSEMCERMMDLTVEIDGDIRSLEQALRRFTAYEMLEGSNKYQCSRCKSYAKAKKKLSVFQAPNILTIVLKRFQAGTFTKLNKLVKFPQKLDMTPFMSRSSDGYPQYSLYAVVVHLDVKSSAFCGHYVCYVKNYNEEWFKIDDSVVIRVDLESVLSEEAYILLYARQSPRPTSSMKDTSDGKPPGAYLHAVPARSSDKSAIPKARHNSSDAATMQHQSSRKGYAKDSPYLEEWVTHSVESIPRVNSSSEASSLFSYSEEGTCSTPTTKESASVEDFTDCLFSSGK